MRRYPKVYNAVRAAIQNDVDQGILSPDRLEPCTELSYSKCLRAIKLGLRTPDECVEDYAI